MNQSQPRKTLSLNFRNRNNVKIYDLEDDFKVEKSVEEKKDGIIESQETIDEIKKIEDLEAITHQNIINNENDLINQESTSEPIQDKKLFKKTLSRIVFVQLIDSILSDDNIKKNISKNDLVLQFSSLMNFIAENNFHECSFIRNKQLSNNFIYDLFLTFNEHYFEIEKSVKNACQNQWEIYINDAIYSSIIYCAIVELFYTEKKNIEKDHKKIILNEYLLISEYFVNDNEIKFINGILNTIFYKNIEKLEKENNETKENILELNS
jgi:transcription termination factor NusB